MSKKIKFTNRSGNRRREVPATFEYCDDGFKIDYSMVREEKDVDENGVPVLKKVHVDRTEIAKFSDIDALIRRIPYFSFLFNAIVLLVLIFILIAQSGSTWAWYMILLAIAIPAITVYDTVMSVRGVLVSYEVRFLNQVQYVIRFQTKADADQFNVLVTRGKDEADQSSQDD